MAISNSAPSAFSFLFNQCLWGRMTARRRLWLILCILMFVTCKRTQESDIEPQKQGLTSMKDHHPQHNYSIQDRRDFYVLHAEHVRHCELPSVRVSSQIETRLDCQAVRDMKQAGWRFVPFIIEQIERGDFFLAPTLDDITGVRMHERYGVGTQGGAQSEARQWVRWWNEEGHKEYEVWLEKRDQ